MFELNSILKQAQEFSGKIHEVHEQLSQIRVTGSAAGGMVIVEMNGHQNMLSCKIDPALFKSGDQELLEELIIAATNDAVSESRIKQSETLQSLADIGDPSSLGDIIGKLMPK
ncbi:MAG: YbaB/EbfC family nucleoid-associated protein [Planctomycetaceae bacterium]|jgi:DNA-binding YbaB/EbfC family protein|nr:YbaB/EbfC family nucleoid-associated protein [Planctomycetaceae bacterium]